MCYGRGAIGRANVWAVCEKKCPRCCRYHWSQHDTMRYTSSTKPISSARVLYKWSKPQRLRRKLTILMVCDSAMPVCAEQCLTHQAYYNTWRLAAGPTPANCTHFHNRGTDLLTGRTTNAQEKTMITPIKQFCRWGNGRPGLCDRRLCSYHLQPKWQSNQSVPDWIEPRGVLMVFAQYHWSSLVMAGTDSDSRYPLFKQ